MSDSVFGIFTGGKSIGRNKALVAKNVSNSYNKKKFLENINFVVYQGEIFSIIGLSGSGKSSLIKVIIGLCPKTSGKIFLFGRHPFFSKKMVGYCHQEDSFLPNLTLMENIELFSSITGAKKKSAIKIGMDFLKKFRLEKHKDDYPFILSGGQRRRLNIVLSCLHSPKLLILDEPFAGLDYYNRRLLWDFFTDLKNRGVSIVLTTHLLNEAQDYSSRVFILKNGKKFAYGTFSDILGKARFNHLYHIRFNHLSKSFFEKMKSFCDFKKIRIIYSYKREIQFALENLSEKSRIDEFLKKNGQSYDELALAEPTLDEFMLVSV
ncbi:MAG: ABC transporter ATP-binding protein [Candidatus Nanoarchaeia archaeon]|nr:ABC transporter ATP-binding protein [Candidatus Nanoarchaeia archaeon]MDD5054298.1 ABC transporter ATP-binding protein [Candidatus Nanoarchaeia archaeon]